MEAGFLKFNAHTAVVLDTSGIGFRFGRIPKQTVRPKTNKSPAHMKKNIGNQPLPTTLGPNHKLISIFTALHNTLDFMLRLL